MNLIINNKFNTLLTAILFVAIDGRQYEQDIDIDVRETGLQYVNGRGSYGCVDSYFDAVVRVVKRRQEPNICTDFWVQESADNIYALRHNRPPVVLQMTGFASFHGDQGSETYRQIGVINGGECSGDRITIDNVNHVSRGTCATGVTQVDSYPEGSAVLRVVGRCNSTCVGRQVVDYRPGKGVQ